MESVFDVIYVLLEYVRTAKWNLFVKVKQRKKASRFVNLFTPDSAESKTEKSFQNYKLTT